MSCPNAGRKSKVVRRALTQTYPPFWHTSTHSAEVSTSKPSFAGSFVCPPLFGEVPIS
jgi:hypothetical protein